MCQAWKTLIYLHIDRLLIERCHPFSRQSRGSWHDSASLWVMMIGVYCWAPPIIIISGYVCQELCGYCNLQILLLFIRSQIPQRVTLLLVGATLAKLDWATFLFKTQLNFPDEKMCCGFDFMTRASKKCRPTECMFPAAFPSTKVGWWRHRDADSDHEWRKQHWL